MAQVLDVQPLVSELDRDEAKDPGQPARQTPWSTARARGRKWHDKPGL